MDGNGVFANDALQQLSEGNEQFIRIDRKAILEKIMVALGAREAPIYSVVDCGAVGVKVSIKLDVSSLTTPLGERISFSVVEGDVFLNAAAAESSAIVKALKHLHQNHLIRVLDFSSRLTEKLESFKTHDLVIEGIACLEKVLEQWELTLGKSENFCVLLEQEEFADMVAGARTPKGKVYGLLTDYLTSIQTTLHGRTKDVRSELIEIKADRRNYEERLSAAGQISMTRPVPFNEVVVPCKELLDYVLSYFGLDDAEYTNGPDRHGMVKSKVSFEFPQMPNFQFGGQLAISGKAYTSAESDEEAAYEALLFIENNFMIKVVDYNYSLRKKALKTQSTLLLLLSRTLELADSVKMMFGELINTIEGQRRRFTFDPSSFFSGPMAAGQIDAYHYCGKGLEEVDKYAVICYGLCAPEFEALQKLTWKLTAAKTNLLL